MDQELTLSEILTDPLIRVMLTADGISINEFADFLHQAALRLRADIYAPLGKANSIEADLVVVRPSNPGGAEAFVQGCTAKRGIGLAFA